MRIHSDILLRSTPAAYQLLRLLSDMIRPKLAISVMADVPP
jgi:hypothetical protein